MRMRRLSRWVSATAALALVAASVVLVRVGVATNDAGIPAASFRPSVGWWAVTTGPTTARLELPPQVWAINGRRNGGALMPFGVFEGLKHLGRDGIVVWVTTIGPRRLSGFADETLPLRLRDFRVDRSWEMQPAGTIQQRLRAVRVGGWQLDVRVYFGTQHPNGALLAKAQAQLNRLVLPRA